MADGLAPADIRAWLAAFATAFVAHREEFDELDRRSGDGDFGSNLSPAFERARAELDACAIASASEPFVIVSTALMRAGGSSGPLLAMWFRAFAGAIGENDVMDRHTLAAAAADGLATVRRLGGASVGDKTMVDAMEPAATALSCSLDVDQSVKQDLIAAAVASRCGAEASAELLARRGRASYVGELARGVRDPGAVAIALFFEAAAADGSPRGAG
jgi:phosphoenolpyruvate---glycerone phosphotransferase subunit DhaL